MSPVLRSSLSTILHFCLFLNQGRLGARRGEGSGLCGRRRSQGHLQGATPYHINSARGVLCVNSGNLFSFFFLYPRCCVCDAHISLALRWLWSE
ncbi:hypothetical protein B0J18DRAFT_96174 [Chaetomium sp. MPI-SDFR-AT-0129]|nr:hypothetical protein B0J18DRAFT_96174 [Chaetomium sp. MPI-SDFR-AT-0129]